MRRFSERCFLVVTCPFFLLSGMLFGLAAVLADMGWKDGFWPILRDCMRAWVQDLAR
jgi:hypothetical protein